MSRADNEMRDDYLHAAAFWRALVRCFAGVFITLSIPFIAVLTPDPATVTICAVVAVSFATAFFAVRQGVQTENFLAERGHLIRGIGLMLVFLCFAFGLSALVFVTSHDATVFSAGAVILGGFVGGTFGDRAEYLRREAKDAR